MGSSTSICGAPTTVGRRSASLEPRRSATLEEPTPDENTPPVSPGSIPRLHDGSLRRASTRHLSEGGASAKIKIKAALGDTIQALAVSPTARRSNAECGGGGGGSGAAATAARRSARSISSGLAARRNFTSAPIAVEKESAGSRVEKEKPVKSPTDQGKPVKSPRPRRRRRIMRCESFGARYETGREVMPSCHKGMKVLHGKRRGSDLPVVIKVRQKRKSFKGSEEQEWRISTEFMLNLPPSENIAKLYEVLEDEYNYYIIMEDCKGQDLFECVRAEKGKLAPDEAREVLSQILDALADLHAQGMIHKDVKLENVVIDKTPTTSRSVGKVWSERTDTSTCGSMVAKQSVKLIDFDTVEEYTPKTPKRVSDVMGTDQYIAQEAYAGKYSFASDIFAVGVIGYRMLVGSFPFNQQIFDDQPGENWVGSPKMKEIRKKLRQSAISWDHEVFSDQPLAAELLKSLLATDETQRPSAAEAADHPWFKDQQDKMWQQQQTEAMWNVAMWQTEETRCSSDGSSGGSPSKSLSRSADSSRSVGVPKSLTASSDSGSPSESLSRSADSGRSVGVPKSLTGQKDVGSGTLHPGSPLPHCIQDL